jgi:lysophospholipase L1-like esterase
MKKTLLSFLFLLIITSFTADKISWVAIGDSITYLNDHPNETGNRITKGYMTLVAEKLPKISFENKGFNGWTSGGIADKIETLGLKQADIYSIFLGTNDWWQGRPIGNLSDYDKNTGSKTIYGAFRIIIDKLHLLNPKANIVLITPMQRGDFVYITNAKNNAYGSYKPKKDQNLSAVADAIIEIGNFEKIPVIDLFNKSGINQKNMVKYKWLKDNKTGDYKKFKYPKYIDVPFDTEKDEYPYPITSINMTYDGLHPSDKGYRVISKMIVKEFKKFEILK